MNKRCATSLTCIIMLPPLNGKKKFKGGGLFFIHKKGIYRNFLYHYRYFRFVPQARRYIYKKKKSCLTKRKKKKNCQIQARFQVNCFYVRSKIDFNRKLQSSGRLVWFFFFSFIFLVFFFFRLVIKILARYFYFHLIILFIIHRHVFFFYYLNILFTYRER